MAKNDIVKECEKIINKKHIKNQNSIKAKICFYAIYIIIAVGAFIKLAYSFI